MKEIITERECDGPLLKELFRAAEKALCDSEESAIDNASRAVSIAKTH
jgi:hypothetical protein